MSLTRRKDVYIRIRREYFVAKFAFTTKNFRLSQSGDD